MEEKDAAGVDMRNAFLLAVSPCSPYAKDHRVKGKGRWWLFQKKALQFALLPRASRVQLFPPCVPAGLSLKNLRLRETCGAVKPKAVDDKQCTAITTWPGRGRGTSVVSKGGSACRAVTDSGWAHPASTRSSQLAGLVKSRLPSLPRGCINSN